MNIEIARLHEAELSQLEEIERLTHLTFWGWESYSALTVDDNFIYTRVARVAQDGVRPVAGFIIARFVEGEAEVMKIGVHPRFQKAGIGGRLLDAAMAEAAARGCMYCYLEVRKSNGAAIQFYKNRRFDLCGFRKNYYASPLEDAFVMRRRLLTS